MEEQTIKVWGRDLKVQKSYGNTYVCGEKTGGLWYTVLRVESDPRGNTYVCVDPGVKFSLFDETKKKNKPWKVKRSFIRGQENRTATGRPNYVPRKPVVSPTVPVAPATQKGETK